MKPDRFPVLSIRQPFADLVVLGIKDVENRSRRITVRGPLLIHASLARPEQDMIDLTTKTLRRGGFIGSKDVWTPTLGAVVGVVNIVDCVSKSSSEWFEGPFGWVLEDAESFENEIPFKGAVGIFYVPSDSLPTTVAKSIERRREKFA